MLHDLRHCKVKAGGNLSDAAELSKGILFSTYDLLIAGKTRALKPSAAATAGSSDAHAMGCEPGSSPAAPDDVDLGRREFGTTSYLFPGSSVLSHLIFPFDDMKCVIFSCCLACLRTTLVAHTGK